MDELAANGYEGRPPAMTLLVIYICVFLILLPRELQFPRDVKPPATRRIFIFQDISIQICIPGMAIHAILPKGVSLRKFTLLGLLLMLSFTSLWISVIWAGWSRYMYTCRILNEGSRRSAEELRRIQELLKSKGIETDEIKDVDA